MAIYHFQAQIISRSDGKSAVSSAAYRSGEKLYDEREGVSFSYADSERVAHTEIVAPSDAPAWAQSRESLWNQVEAREKRKDSQLAREFEVALPRELNQTQQIELLRGWLAAEITPAGAIADFAIHVDEHNNNPHGHIMTTMRPVSAEGWGRLKIREWEDRAVLDRWRESWAAHTNAALKRARVRTRVDHRSNAERGIAEEPTKKEGPGARGRAGRGQPSDRVAENVRIRKRNAQRAIQAAVAAIVALAKAFAPKEKAQDKLRALAKGRKPPSQQPQAAAGPILTSPRPAQTPTPAPTPAATKPAPSPAPPPPAQAPDDGLSAEVLAAMMKKGRGR
jgi:ATP-dependent exoDNAse (exonuclease V) alpha subunit